MTRWLYSVIMILLQPWLRLKLYLRARHEPVYGQAVAERFGRYTHPSGEGYLWVHAVSLGETRAAAILIERLRQALPNLRLLLTHGTASGREQGVTLLMPGDVQVWQPWDTLQAVRRFLQHFKPRLGLLLETEVWPNWVAICQRAEVPLVLVNARLSLRSLRQAQRLAWLARPAYQGLAAIWAQAADDALHFKQLGGKVEGVWGNVKFDARPDQRLLEQGRHWAHSWGQPVVLLASSREGEEAAFLQLVCSGQYPGVQWLIVPRHPQRFDEVAELITQKGWSVSRRSTWHGAPAISDVWLGDSLGEMALYYGLAQVALLGGSFEPLGGQNLIEAAACACPVVMGPHTYNFSQAAQWAEAAGAALRATNMSDALEQAVALVQDGARHSQVVQSSRQFATQHQGATERTVQAVMALLKKAVY